MTLSKERLSLSGVWTHYRARVDPKITSKIQKDILISQANRCYFDCSG
jgi:hypothetical protein